MNTKKSQASLRKRPLPPPDSGLKDTGARETMVTGAIREPSNGLLRGRFDLIPPECLAAVYAVVPAATLPCAVETLSKWLANLQRGGFDDRGAAIFARFILEGSGSLAVGVRNLAIHYARGAEKYTKRNPDGTVLETGDRNWEKGMETGRTIDSLFRHLSQLQAGDLLEDHRSAITWNTFTVMWHVPRLADGRLPPVLDTYNLVKVKRAQP